MTASSVLVALCYIREIPTNGESWECESGRSSRQAGWGQQRQSKQETWSSWTCWGTLKGAGSLLATGDRPWATVRPEGWRKIIRLFLLHHEVLWDHWEAGNPRGAAGLEVRRQHESEHCRWGNICFQSFCLLPYPRGWNYFIVILCSGQHEASRSSSPIRYYHFKDNTVRITRVNQVCSPSTQFSWLFV